MNFKNEIEGPKKETEEGESISKMKSHVVSSISHINALRWNMYHSGYTAVMAPFTGLPSWGQSNES